MSNKNERAVFLINAKISMVPADAPLINLPDALIAIERLFSERRAFASLTDSDTVSNVTVGMTPEQAKATNADLSDVVYIADLQRSGDKTIILVTRGDETIASPAFVNRLEREVRIAKPKRDELVGHSCHVIIDSHKRSFGVYRAAIEKVPNVSRTLVIRFLNALLRTDAQRNGAAFMRQSSQRLIPNYPRIDFALQPSASLEKDIKAGRVNSIELISRREEFSGPDLGVNIKRKTRNLAMTLDYEGRPERLINWLKNKLPIMAREENYDEVQINISGLEGKSSASPTFAISRLESAETIYARTAIITDFERPLEQCESVCNDELANKISNVIANEKYWTPSS
ncbi:hypothetical protein [Hyphomicrobium sp. D-2]|uniref:hypothetical protein n=1 Tax=Hyphomicrobium sp. D-2 TaxID=3041621 RepID=UPI002456FA5D|nr:hypothetical protein [Hyphomicrobium sp. D-2]MDH4982476.1 hypothetical protein [Hyphomicrobium sp. D-2]